MISAADNPASVPYAQECAPDLLPLLPDGVYIKCFFNGADQVMRTGPVIHPSGGRHLECNSQRRWSIYVGKRITSFVPLTIQDVFALYPLGKQVQVRMKASAKNNWEGYCPGLVVEHLQKQVKVRVLFADGSAPIEKAYRPTQLRAQ